MSELEATEVIIGREDWEIFLSSLERLMTLQEKMVNQHGELIRRNEALRRELESPQEAPHPPPESLPAVEKRTEQFAARRFTDRILSWLNPSAPPGSGSSRPQSSPNLQPLQSQAAQTLRIDASRQGFAQNYKCGNCGREMTRPSNFCESCGVLFGGLYCRCGALLGSGDRFCFRCGHPVL